MNGIWIFLACCACFFPVFLEEAIERRRRREPEPPIWCPYCRRTHDPDCVYTVWSDYMYGILGYRARFQDSPLRADRSDAVADWCRRMERLQHEEDTCAS